MSNGRRLGILFVWSAIFISVLALAPNGFSAIPKGDAWYTQHYVIMQDFERKLYRTLSDVGRTAFQEVFWAARTPVARAAFEARLAYVMKNFKKENSKQPWNTDRSRVYLLNGSPASIDYSQVDSWGSVAMAGTPQSISTTDRTTEDVSGTMAEVWIYPYQNYFIKYTFAFVRPAEWRMTQSTGDRYLGEFEQYNKTVTFGIADLEKYEQELAGLEKKKKK